MEERASMVLYYNDIKKILFNYYFSEKHPNVQNQVEESGKMLCSIKTKKGLITTKKYIDFMLTYESPIESLGNSIIEQINVSLTKLCNIINEKISDRGYEIDELDENLTYGFGENSNPSLNFITFYLKKKANVKIKKKGLRKNV